MDILSFVSQVVSSLAWPVVVLISIGMVRKQIPELISSLRRLKYKDLEIDFERGVKAIEHDVAIALPEVPKHIGIEKPFEEVRGNSLEDLAAIAPRAAIVEAWLGVESSAIILVRKKGVPVSTSTPGPMRLRDMLTRAGVLNSEQLLVFEELRDLRNKAVHVLESDFSPGVAHSYVKSAQRLEQYLRDLAGKI